MTFRVKESSGLSIVDRPLEAPLDDQDGYLTPQRSFLRPKGLRKATVTDGSTVAGGRITAPDGPGIGTVPILEVIGDPTAVYA